MVFVARTTVPLEIVIVASPDVPSGKTVTLAVLVVRPAAAVATAF